MQIHVFLRADLERKPSSPTRRYLDGLWGACESLGMDRGLGGKTPMDGLPLPLPSARDDGPRVLAGRGSQGPDVLQAFVYGLPDVICFTLMLSHAQPRQWRELSDMWTDVAPVPESGADVLGAIRLFRGLADPESDGQRGLRRIDEAVRQALPGGVPGALIWRGPHVLNAPGSAPSRLAVWEAVPDAASRFAAERTLAIVARPGAGQPDPEPGLDALTWTATGRPELAPLGRALLHAATIRYEARVLRSGSEFRDLRERAEQQVDTLLATTATPTRDVEDLLRVQRELSLLQSGANGLITAKTRLRAMRRTVEIASANLVELLGDQNSMTGDGGFSHDFATARWLIRQAETDEDYLTATGERVREIAGPIESAIRERQAGRREQMMLVQTSCLGAVVMSLTAVQTLGYKVPVSPAVQPALIVFLAVTALVLPPAVLRWPRGLGRPSVFGWLDVSAVVLWSAAAAWLGTEVITRGLGHRVVPAVAAVICLAVTSVAGLWGDSLRRRFADRR